MNYNVYVFLDALNRPYYVGKTNNMERRKKEHLKEIAEGNKLPKYTKARELIANGHPLRMVSLVKTMFEDHAYEIETHFIKKYRKEGYKLYNLTSGGPDKNLIKINNPAKPNQKGLFKVNKKTVNKKKVTKKKTIKGKKKAKAKGERRYERIV